MTAERTVAVALQTAKAECDIQAAAIIGKLRAMDPIRFAEMIGDLLETGDIKLCMTAMNYIKMRRSEAETARDAAVYHILSERRAA
jgi:hypothetical protein